ncbi:hypothetical protein NDU88_003044 [Pleurodeles waltl]|uniref:Uncharacterized protein n=1 Tax=Pleurodeles waltl TaxID=8319 RepID=A0AAV7T537_PLEWA|nr:hypothetical protein NDU88_003044 [Pleurodeles waltl]
MNNTRPRKRSGLTLPPPTRKGKVRQPIPYDFRGPKSFPAGTREENGGERRERSRRSRRRGRRRQRNRASPGERLGAKRTRGAWPRGIQGSASGAALQTFQPRFKRSVAVPGALEEERKGKENLKRSLYRNRTDYY